MDTSFDRKHTNKAEACEPQENMVNAGRMVCPCSPHCQGLNRQNLLGHKRHSVSTFRRLNVRTRYPKRKKSMAFMNRRIFDPSV